MLAIYLVLFYCPIQVAVSLGTPIMGEEWVNKCWECRDDISATATNEIMVRINVILEFGDSVWALFGPFFADICTKKTTLSNFGRCCTE